MSKQHCRTLQVERFFQQCRMLLRHCCWCRRGLTFKAFKRTTVGPRFSWMQQLDGGMKLVATVRTTLAVRRTGSEVADSATILRWRGRTRTRTKRRVGTRNRGLNFRRYLHPDFLDNKKLSYRRGTARRACQSICAMIHEVWELETFQTAKVIFEVIQGHW